MKKLLLMIVASILACYATLSNANPAFTGTYAKAQGAETNSSAQFPASFTPASGTDLANSNQPSFLNITGINTGGQPNTVSRLFDGTAAVGSNYDARFNSGSFTVNFDLSNSSHGYDITRIHTYSASDTSNGGRSDQEFSVTAIYTDNTTKTLTSGTHYYNDVDAAGENGEVNIWTEVKFSSPIGFMAKRVRALRFDFADNNNASYTEFDIIGAPSSAPRQFVHPGIGFTRDDLDVIKANLNVEPWKSAYEDMLDQEQSSLNYQMQGPFTGVGRNQDEANGEWASDMRAVHNLARIWYFTGNEAYAEKARDILMAWANNHEQFLIGQVYLTMGYEAFRVFEGADILRGAWSGWDPNDTEILKEYFSEVWLNDSLQHLAVPAPMRAANQGMAQYAAAINIAVFNDDEELFDQLVHIFRTDGSSALTSSLPNGQVGDSGRDAHDQGQILLWARSAETIWQQGVDVYSELDNRMLAAIEYLARSNSRIETPFIPAGTVYDIYPSYHSFESPDEILPIENSMTSLLHTAYITRSGLDALFLELYGEGVNIGADNFNYFVPNDNSSAELPQPLDGPAEVASVTRLNSRNMGDATGGGSTYLNGTWTISGRGSSLRAGSDPDYHYAFLPVNGDATIIAKMTSFEGGGDSNAQAGLVFTESLDNADRMGGVVLTAPGPDDDLQSFYRGEIASSFRSSSNGKPSQARPKVPYWYKIERIGNRVTLFSSPDGASWSISHVADYDMGATAYYGLAISSDNNNQTATATFTDVRITGADGQEAVETPATPFAIYASSGGDHVTLRWLESFEAQRYRIWRASNAQGPYHLIAEQTGTTFNDRNTVIPNTVYYYQVSAINDAGESPRSATEKLFLPNLNVIQAEDFDDRRGVDLEASQDFFGGQNLSRIRESHWTRYNNIEIDVKDPKFYLRAAGFNDDIDEVQIRIGSSDGPIIGRVTPHNTTAPQRWFTNETTLSVNPGVYDLFLVFTSGGINVNWFEIEGLEPVPVSVPDPTPATIDIEFSTSSNRSNLRELDGAIVAGNIYVLADSPSEIAQVQFFVDNTALSGAPNQTRSSAPFDLQGGSAANANALNTNSLIDGQHTLTLRVFFSNGIVNTRTVAFTVNNNGNASPQPGQPGTTNLALDGSAFQSSTRFAGLATRAIDNNTDGRFSEGSVTHTGDDANAFWQVDLQSESDISQIVIWNRTDCCVNKLSNFTVKVLDQEGQTVWQKFYSTPPNPSLTIDLAVTGASVRIELAGEFSLAEVQVFGTKAVDDDPNDQPSNPPPTNGNVSKFSLPAIFLLLLSDE